MREITLQAIKLWAFTLLPSIFPFMILSSFFMKVLLSIPLIYSVKLQKISNRLFSLSSKGLLILLFGTLCGYPLGAKLTADAVKENQIHISEANYLLTICNQASPAFLEFYVGVYALNSKISTLNLFLIFYLATFLTSLITRTIYHPNYHFISIKKNETSLKSYFIALDESISESCISILRIGGYIVFFALLSYFISSISFIPLNITLPGTILLEITNGLYLLKTNYASHPLYILFVFTFSAFGGFCTMAQIKGMLVGTSLSMKPYIIGKIIFCIIILFVSILI